MRKILLILVLLSLKFTAISQDSIKTFTMNELQVVGIKTEIYEPITISVIKIDSIKKTYQGNDPFFTLNRYVPSVFTQSDGGLPYGYSYMRIRGIDQTRINFTLNGIPLNEMEDQGIYFSNMPDFMNNISEIQVQRGVGTSKYGTTSIGGSVNFETEAPIKSSLTLSAGAGSFKSDKVSLKYNTGYFGKSKIASSFSYSKLNSSGFRRNSGTNGETFFGQVGYFGRKNTIKIYGFRGNSINQMAWLPVTKDLIDKDYRTNLNSSEEVDNFNQNFIAATWVNYSKSNIKFNTSIYGNNINGTYTSFLDSATLGRFGLQSYQTGVMSNMIYTKNRFTLNTGLNYNYYQRRHRLSNNSLPDFLWYSNTGFKQDAIAFSKLNYNCNKWNFFGDLQYRFVKFQYQENDSTKSILSNNWNFINPKFGVKYISDKYELWTSISKTNREVTRSDMFRGYDHLTKVGDSLSSGFGDKSFIINFKPEQVYDFEIGAKFIKKNLSLSSNIYGMYFKNERISNGDVNYIGLLLRQPFNKSYRTGIEVDGTYTYKSISLITNLNYSYNRFFNSESEKWLNHSYTPSFIMNNNIEYKYKSFIFGINGRYVSKTYLDNTQNEKLTTPNYYILNFNTGFKSKYTSLYLNVNNFINQKYYLPGGVTNNSPAYYVGALRNIFLSFSINI
jgi:iron complex outermembrane receptor protein